MTISNTVRADGRALLGAAALGSCMGLAIGGAYLAGGMARSATDAAQVAEAAPVAPLPAAEAPALRASVAPERGFFARLNRPTRRVVPAVAPFSLRGSIAGSRDLECLTQAVYYEARGETDSGQAAVAQVVLNRVRHPRFPKSICGVVFQQARASCQFSFACDGSTRRRLEGAAWTRARRVASRALDGFVMAQVGSATDFRRKELPNIGLMRVAQIGSHAFYRFGGRLGGAEPLRAEPQPSTGRTVMAGFSAPSAEQVLAAGEKLVASAAAAVTSATHRPAAAPTVEASPAATPTPVVETVVKAEVFAPKLDVATTPTL